MASLLALLAVAAFLALSVPGVVLARSKAGTSVIYGATLGISLAALVNALPVILSGTAATELVLPLGLPWIGAHFRLDVLSSFFLVVINLGGAIASLYALGYGRHESDPHRVLPFYPAFLATMNLVVIAADAFSFLLAWETMSLASAALVMAHHRNPENVRAGFIYLVMASFGTLALLLAFGVLAGPQSAYDFASIRGMANGDLATAVVLALVLIGTGSKAGLVPLHVWLPLAHPAAPSHVSGLMSGVMTKVAVYGFIRIVFDLMNGAPWWSSTTVLILAGATALMGVLYALMQTDLKKLLAYSTVENIGIIFVGLGLALGFRANGMGEAAALSLTAALFHVFNHSLFKNLLFLGSGAVLTATGERNMENLGGLIHRMRGTALLFLIGCAAISALPPLNGFASEWLALQAILLSPSIPQWGLRILIPAIGALLALAAALAAACFVRAFGICFLGRARSAASLQAVETDRFSLAAMVLPALLCLLAGILPGPVIDFLRPVSTALLADQMPLQAGNGWQMIVPVSASRSSYDGLLVFIFIALSASLASFAIHRLASRTIRRAPAWDCGFPDPSPATQYSAVSFAQPIRRVYGTIVFRARELVTMPGPGELKAAVMQVTLHDLVWDSLYEPVVRAVNALAERLNRFQFLTIRRYLTLVFVALIALLLVLALWL